MPKVTLDLDEEVLEELHTLREYDPLAKNMTDAEYLEELIISKVMTFSPNTGECVDKDGEPSLDDFSYVIYPDRIPLGAWDPDTGDPDYNGPMLGRVWNGDELIRVMTDEEVERCMDRFKGLNGIKVTIYHEG